MKCQDVAKVVGVSTRHIADLCSEGTIVAVNIAGAHNRKCNFWRIPASAYDAWIMNRSGASF